MQLKQTWIGSFLLVVLLGLSACYYDSEEFLYGITPVQCDPTPVQFSAQVTGILQRNCYACHSVGSNLGNLLLDSYSGVRDAAKNGSLMGSVRHEGGYDPMPQGAGKLSECDIQALQTWVDDGMPNN